MSRRRRTSTLPAPSVSSLLALNGSVFGISGFVHRGAGCAWKGGSGYPCSFCLSEFLRDLAAGRLTTHSAMAQFPRSLKELRNAEQLSSDYRAIWTPLETFFALHGLILWSNAPDGYGQMVPPDSRSRAPDGFSHRWPGELDRFYHFVMMRSTLCPARTLDGRDVVIRVVSIEKEGTNQLQALKRLATGNIASAIGNHTAPVLQWLHKDDISFAVLPYLSYGDPTTMYLYENTQDLLNHLLQMVEAVDFCHTRLVAHRDLCHENFLCNFYGAAGVDASYNPPRGRLARPLRSLFPFKVYLIDFDRAVCFDEGSDPQSHLVTGLPHLSFDHEAGEWQRAVAPEVNSDKPHNPFMADVWQLGTYWAELEEENRMHESLLALIGRMTATFAEDRPTAREAMLILREVLSQLSLEELRTPVWKDPELNQGAASASV